MLNVKGGGILKHRVIDVCGAHKVGTEAVEGGKGAVKYVVMGTRYGGGGVRLYSAVMVRW